MDKGRFLFGWWEFDYLLVHPFLSMVHPFSINVSMRPKGSSLKSNCIGGAWLDIAD